MFLVGLIKLIVAKLEIIFYLSFVKKSDLKWFNSKSTLKKSVIQVKKEKKVEYMVKLNQKILNGNICLIYMNLYGQSHILSITYSKNS